MFYIYSPRPPRIYLEFNYYPQKIKPELIPCSGNEATPQGLPTVSPNRQ